MWIAPSDKEPPVGVLRCRCSPGRLPGSCAAHRTLVPAHLPQTSTAAIRFAMTEQIAIAASRAPAARPPARHTAARSIPPRGPSSLSKRSRAWLPTGHQLAQPHPGTTNGPRRRCGPEQELPQRHGASAATTLRPLTHQPRSPFGLHHRIRPCRKPTQSSRAAAVFSATEPDRGVLPLPVCNSARRR